MAPDPRRSAPLLAAAVSVLIAVLPIASETVAVPGASGVRRDLEWRRGEFVARTATDLACEHAWAGVYRFAYCGLVVETLAVTPDLGFARAVETCQGPAGWRFGRVETVDDRIVLTPGSGVSDELLELYPVRWGENAFLVEPAALDEFAHAAARGEQPTDGFYASRELGTLPGGRPVFALTGEPLLP